MKGTEQDLKTRRKREKDLFYPTSKKNEHTRKQNPTKIPNFALKKLKGK